MDYALLRKRLKKCALSTLMGYLIGLIFPVATAFAIHAAAPEIDVTGVQTSLIKEVQPFSITFSVNPILASDPRPAEARVSLTVRRRVGGSCFLPVGEIIRNLATNAVLTEGSYGPPDPRFTWDGRDALNSFVLDGVYCYYFTARNEYGVFVYSYPSVATQSNAIVVSSPAGESGGSGGSGGNEEGESGPISQSYIQHRADPAVVNLYHTPSDTAFVNFTVTQDPPGGSRMTIQILAPDGRLVSANFPDFPTSVGTSGSFSWDGRCTAGGVLNPACNNSGNGRAESGIYTYQFLSGGFLLDSGRIVVENAAPVVIPEPDPEVFIEEHSAVPNRFTSGGSTSIRFQTGKAVTGLQVTVIGNGAGQTRSLSVFPGTSSATPAEFVAPWDGKFLVAGVETVAPAGTYTYTITATGETSILGTITVNAAPSTGSGGTPQPEPDPFIVTHPGSLQTTQGTPVAITFTTGRTVSNLRVKVKNGLGSSIVRELVVMPVTGTSAIAGTYTATWDTNVIQTCNSFTGACTLRAANAGLYRYELSATGQTAVSGEITVDALSGGGGGGTTGGGSGTTPAGPMEITNFQVSPSVFSPHASQSVTLTFQVNKAARVDINVYTSVHTGTPVITKNLLAAGTSTNVAQGTFSVTWNGHSTFQNRFLNLVGDNGAYVITVDARGTSGEAADTESASITIANATTGGGGTNTTLGITNFGASPSVFNPYAENTEFRYQINQSGQVTIRVYPSTFSPTSSSSAEPTNVASLLTLDENITKEANVTYARMWNGRNSLGSIVSDNSYPFVIRVSNANGTVYSWGLVTIRTFTLTDLGSTRPSFRPDSPYNETTTLRFEVNRANTSFAVSIEGGVPAATLQTLPVTLVQTYASGNQTIYRYEATWNGKNSSGILVATNTYTYRIRATSDGQIAERTGWVRVERTTTTTTDGSGTTTTSGNCSGFTDVPATHSLCPAIQFVVSKGIFLGDGGRNTLRLGDMLKRAETARVVQSAFGYSLSTYDRNLEGNLGFRDLDTNQWYMPYLKTFTMRSRNILKGYPDGLMRPMRTMNRAEMFKVFVEGAFDAPRATMHFNLRSPITFKPFTDTPVNRDTKWYLKYADWANVNDLITTQFFYPAKGISRATMIKLIYDTHTKGLITYRTSVASN